MDVLDLLLLLKIVLLLVIVHVLLINLIKIDISLPFILNSLVLKLKIMKINKVLLCKSVIFFQLVDILGHLHCLLSQHFQLVLKLNLRLKKWIILVKMLGNAISISSDCKLVVKMTNLVSWIMLLQFLFGEVFRNLILNRIDLLVL